MRKALILPFLAIFAALLIMFCLPHNAPAHADFVGEITIKQTDGGFYYSYGGDDDETVYPTLQDLITALENEQTGGNNLRLIFNNVTSSAPITLEKSYVISGQITFDIENKDYAISVNTNSFLRISGGEISSNRGGIEVKTAATGFEMTGGQIRITDCDLGSPKPALYSKKTANLTGGSIINTAAFGSGIYMAGGTISINPEGLFSITAPTAIFANQGNLTINGGVYASNYETNNQYSSDYGYSVLVKNTASVTINSGTFNAPLCFNSASTAALTISGGNYNDVLYLPSIASFGGSVTIKNVDFVPSTDSKVKMDLSNISSDTVTFESIAGDGSNNGYSVKKYYFASDEDTKYDLDTAVNLTDNSGETVRFYSDNKCYLSVYVKDVLTVDNEEHSYNDDIICADLDFDLPGYTLLGWRKNGLSTVTTFKIKGDVRLDAWVKLNPCVVTLDNTFTRTYNAQNYEVTASISHPLINIATFTYRWQKKVGENYEFIPGATTPTLNVRDVADSGTYRLLATVEDDDFSADTQSNDVVVTINKATSSNISHDPLNGTYSESQTLDDFDLSAGFSWGDASVIKPTVNQTTYPATYNPDPNNYEDLAVNITLILAKASPSAPSPVPSANVTYYASLTLADAALPALFRWADESTVPDMGTNGYQAYYNPDSVNYNDYPITLYVTVNKADYVDITIAPLTKAYNGENFYNLNHLNAFIGQERNNWRLVTTGYDLLEMGAHTYACLYNADSAHYNDFAADLEFTLEKGTLVGSWSHNEVSVPFGSALSTVALNSNYYWYNGATEPHFSGVFPAYYNPDPAHYNNYDLDISVVVIKADYNANDVIIPALSSVTYDPNGKLSDIVLPEHYTWTDGNITPTVAVGSYAASFCDNDNHNPFALNIPLTVNRATINTPVFSDLTVTYDGQEHTLTATDISPLISVTYDNNVRTLAGTNTATVYITQSDVDNYVVLPTALQAKLIVKKAPSVITAPARIDVAVGGTVTIEASVNNNEQIVLIPPINTDNEGVQTIRIYTEESANYAANSADVIVSVNPTQAYVGFITYPDDYDYGEYYGMIEAESGVPADAQVKFLSTEDKAGVTISLSNVSDEENFTVKLLMPKDMRKTKNLVLIKNGEPIDYRVESGVYLVFDAKNGDTVYFEKQQSAFIWYWIPPVAAVLVAGIVVFILYKKKIIFNKPKKTDDAPAAEE